MTALLTTEDTLILDEMLGHEAGCQAEHTDADNRVCSVSVTHRICSVCRPPILVCANSAARNSFLIALRFGRCVCDRPISDCWTVTPA